jgi:uncharacterized protein YndB with AHSA1/START domain
MANPSANDDKYLHIERTLPAPRSLVYRSFTEPQRMMRWFGPRDFDATTITLDLREGGAWRGGMRGPDGKELLASGVYRKIVPDQLLVFTYAWENDGVRGHETVCRLELTDQGQQTRLVFSQGPFETSTDSRDHEAGWSEAFDKLPRAVQS